MKLSEFLWVYHNFRSAIKGFQQVSHQSNKPFKHKYAGYQSFVQPGQKKTTNNDAEDLLRSFLYYKKIELEDDREDFKKGGPGSTNNLELWNAYKEDLNFSDITQDANAPKKVNVLIKFDSLYELFVQLMRYGTFGGIKRRLLDNNKKLLDYCYGKPITLDELEGREERQLSLDEMTTLFQRAIRRTFREGKIKIYDNLAKNQTFLSYYMGEEVKVGNQTLQISDKQLIDNFKLAIKAANRGDRLDLFEKMFKKSRLRSTIQAAKNEVQTEILRMLVNSIQWSRMKVPDNFSQLRADIRSYVKWVHDSNPDIVNKVLNYTLQNFNNLSKKEDKNGTRWLRLESLIYLLPEARQRYYKAEYEKIFCQKEAAYEKPRSELTGRDKKRQAPESVSIDHESPEKKQKFDNLYVAQTHLQWCIQQIDAGLANPQLQQNPWVSTQDVLAVFSKLKSEMEYIAGMIKEQNTGTIANTSTLQAQPELLHEPGWFDDNRGYTTTIGIESNDPVRDSSMASEATQQSPFIPYTHLMTQHQTALFRSNRDGVGQNYQKRPEDDSQFLDFYAGV